MAQPPGRKFITPFQRGWASVRSMEETHRLYIRNELFQARDLIPLLMKHRNGEKWTPEERARLLHDLRTLSGLSPYLLPILLPGGIFMLPLIAWWLDLRRKKRQQKTEQQAHQSSCANQSPEQFPEKSPAQE